MKTVAIVATSALVLHIFAFGLYEWNLIVGDARPNAASWAIWGFITILNFTSYRAMSRDWVKSILPTVGSLLCILTFVIALVRGRFATPTVYDLSVMTIGLCAALVWWWTRRASIAQILLQIGIAIGFIPTFGTVWVDPTSEPAACWLLWAIAFSLQTLVVLMRWQGQKTDLLYPVNCTGLHLAVGILALR